MSSKSHFFRQSNSEYLLNFNKANLDRILTDVNVVIPGDFNWEIKFSFSAEESSYAALFGNVDQSRVIVSSSLSRLIVNLGNNSILLASYPFLFNTDYVLKIRRDINNDVYYSVNGSNDVLLGNNSGQFGDTVPNQVLNIGKVGNRYLTGKIYYLKMFNYGNWNMNDGSGFNVKGSDGNNGTINTTQNINYVNNVMWKNVLQLSFIATFRTTTANETLTLPYDISGTFSGTIDWGDGTVVANNYANRMHTYINSGDYDVTVNGEISGFRYAGSGDRLKIINIKQWGIYFIVGNRQFERCENLNITATDTPIITSSVLQRTFQSTDLIFNDSINNWDVSSVNQYIQTFNNTSLFNQPLNNWDVSSATSFNNMFSNSFNNGIFNQPLNNWNVGNVTLFNNMFQGQVLFNQDIGNWNTQSATNMINMFLNCYAFNQDISNWDFSSLNTANSLLQFMLNKTFNDYDAAYYDNLLIKWASSPSIGGLPVGVIGTIDMGTIKYTSNGASARASILSNNKALTINDGGQI
jgi:hypothetical protein